VRSDNTTAIAYVNRFGGCHSSDLLFVAKRLWKWCEKHNHTVFATHIPGVDNVVADFESRRDVDISDWSLSESIFKSIIVRFGEPEIDMFATKQSKKVKRFVSQFPQPLCEAVDAFTVNWGNYFSYIFPPFCLLPRVIKKIVMDNAKCILIFPLWYTQAWYPLIKNLSNNEIIEIGPDENLLCCPYRKISHPLWKTLRLGAVLFTKS
jgi:hypothetical protein